MSVVALCSTVVACRSARPDPKHLEKCTTVLPQVFHWHLPLYEEICDLFTPSKNNTACTATLLLVLTVAADHDDMTSMARVGQGDCWRLLDRAPQNAPNVSPQ